LTEWAGIQIIAPARELGHPMWRRMWERAGVVPHEVPVQTLESWLTRPDLTPTVLVPMGEEALRAVAGERDLFRWRGRRFQRFFPQGTRLICPTLTPSQLLPHAAALQTVTNQLALRPTRFQGAWIFDVQRILRERETLVLPRQTYLEDPSPAVFADWATATLRTPTAQLSFDIETHYKLDVTDESAFDEEELKMGAMLRISFASQPHHAVSVPWTREYFDTIRALLESPLPKVVWNGAQFDVPRLRAEGFPVNGRIYDYQDGWHLLESDQPKGLEYVSSFYTVAKPWKHLSGSLPALYSCLDADLALQNAIGIEADLKHFGLWDLFERHVVDLMPILDRAGQRGNLIDQAFSQDLKVQLEAYKGEMVTKAQAYVPDVLKPRKHYKRRPDDTEGRTLIPVTVRGTTTCCTVCQRLGVKKADHFKGGKANPCKAAHGTIETVEADVTEWDEILPFNPSSSQQLLAYMAHFKHPQGRDPKTGAPSADSKHLAKLAKQYGATHPLYPMLAEYSKVSKTLSTYIYTPDQDGLIHTTYVNAPSTWRLASRNVNLQNVGKRESNPWATKARRQIIARPGHIFVQADSTSIEAVITGWLINDDNFIAVAKKSIHAYLCCQDLGWDFTDETIEQVKKEHKKLYNQFKTAVYLLLYGGDPYLMHMTNPEQFPTKADAQQIQDKIFGMMPALKAWQDQTREQAKKDGELRSPWGYRHKFYDVYSFKKTATGQLEYHETGQPKLKLGQDAKRALAFRPQNAAGAFCRDTLLQIGESEWGPYMSANVSVHDGYTLEVPEALAAQASDFLVATLTRLIPELGGLRIGCDVEWGYNWADASAENPRGMRLQRKVEV
jgi:DNA polymerase I-like protein with 3'-5' exonuclease and polymerase domains